MARLPSERKSRLHVADVDIDLKPIMGLICILIPLLVYAFSFYEIKLQPVSAPKIGAPPPQDAGDEQKKPLNLTVLLTEPGFAVKMEKELAEGEADINIPKKSFQTPDGRTVTDYDYPELYAKLLEIKKKFRNETTINIGADPDVTWETIARTIDAARVELKDEKFKDLKSYSEAPEATDDEGRPRLMFPQVVFVVAE